MALRGHLNNEALNHLQRSSAAPLMKYKAGARLCQCFTFREKPSKPNLMYKPCSVVLPVARS
eukprot:7060146-Pyramimonas_sp.AAC.1